jgi:hypothetical protein
VQLSRLSWTEAEQRVPVDRRFDPELATRERYDHQYQAFAKVYGRVKPWYKFLNG